MAYIASDRARALLRARATRNTADTPLGPSGHQTIDGAVLGIARGRVNEGGTAQAIVLGLRFKGKKGKPEESREDEEALRGEVRRQSPMKGWYLDSDVACAILNPSTARDVARTPISPKINLAIDGTWR